MKLWMLGCALLSSACTNANAISYDARNDLHCYALSTYFAAVEQKSLATGNARDVGSLSVLVVHEWFVTKFKNEAVRIGKPLADARAKALYEAIGSDFEMSKTAFKECVDRAAKDPAFETFARATVRL